MLFKMERNCNKQSKEIAQTNWSQGREKERGRTREREKGRTRNKLRMFFAFPFGTLTGAGYNDLDQSLIN